MKQSNLIALAPSRVKRQRTTKSNFIVFFWRNQRGYTLVELMVVVTALGILISAAIPAYVGFTRSSRELQATTHLQKIAIKLEHHYNKTMSYQTTLATLALQERDSWFQYRIESNHHKQYQVIASPHGNSISRREFGLNQHGLHQHRAAGSNEWLSGWS